MLRLLAVVLIVGCGGQRIAMNEGDAEGKEAAKQIKQSLNPDADFPESRSAEKNKSDSDRQV